MMRRAHNGIKRAIDEYPVWIIIASFFLNACITFGSVVYSRGNDAHRIETLELWQKTNCDLPTKVAEMQTTIKDAPRIIALEKQLEEGMRTDKITIDSLAEIARRLNKVETNQAGVIARLDGIADQINILHGLPTKNNRNK